MTKKELLEKLKDVPDNAEIRIAADGTEFYCESADYYEEENIFYVVEYE